MEAEIPTFRKGCVTSLVVMLTLGLVTLILAPTTGSYRGFYLCLALGSIILISSIVYLPIVYVKKARDLKDLAVPTMQSLWISTSMGIGYVTTALAPYFQITLSIAAFLFIVGWILVIFGVHRLLLLSKKSGAPLAI